MMEKSFKSICNKLTEIKFLKSGIEQATKEKNESYWSL